METTGYPAPHAADGVAANRADVEAALARVLGSNAFEGSARHRDFLARVVARTLEGEARTLKETTIGIEVFGRDAATFDPRIDPIVRVEAGRLRKRLARYYADEGADDAVAIALPHGSYVPEFVRRRSTVATDPAPRAAPSAAGAGASQASAALADGDARAPFAGRAQRTRSLTLVALASLAVLVALAGIVREFLPRASRTPSIAVLPFLNLTGDPALEPLTDGLTDEVTDALTRVPGVDVAARTSAFAYKDRRDDVRAIGRALGVGTVLEGSVQRANGALKVIVQLDSAATGFHLWSQVLDAPGADLAAAESSIARTVAASLAPELARQAGAAAGEHAPEPRAWQAFARGYALLRGGDPARVDDAVALAREAIAADPAYAKGYALLGMALQTKAFAGGPIRADLRDASTEALLTALRLDASMAQLYANLGNWALLYDYDWPRAETLYQRAIALAPRNPNGYEGYADGLLRRGRFAEADAAYERALELDPLLGEVVFARATVPYYAGQYQEAEARLLRLVADNPGAVGPWLGLVSARFMAHDDAGVAEALSRVAAMIPGSPLLDAARASIACRKGARDRVDFGAIERMLGAVAPFIVAAVHAGCGDAAAAVAWLTRARDRHDPMFANVGIEPLLAPLRDGTSGPSIRALAPGLFDGSAVTAPAPVASARTPALRR